MLAACTLLAYSNSFSVPFSGLDDKEGARLEFANALELDAKIGLPKTYRTKEMAALLDSVKAEFATSDSGSGEEPPPDEEKAPPADEDCDGSGFSHALVETARDHARYYSDADEARGAERERLANAWRDLPHAVVKGAA